MNLHERIVERIRRDGPITFAAFMDAALYDPDGGFYSRPPVGPRGDFVTSPHVSSVFGRLLATQIDGMWKRLGKPDALRIVECGAGDGTLAKQILEHAQAPLRYEAVEISGGAREALREAGITARAGLQDVEQIEHGVVLANELLDNLPFHRVRFRDGKPFEVFVDVDEQTLIEIEQPATVDAAEEDGDEVLVSPAAEAFARDAVRTLRRGWVVLFDYGHAPGEPPLPVRAYESHTMHDALLRDPGSADITAGVDFGAIANAAAVEGATVFGPRTQRDVLKALGFDDAYAALREQRLRAEAERDSKAILRLLAEQSRAPLLVDPAHLGGLKAIAFGVGVAEPPPGF